MELSHKTFLLSRQSSTVRSLFIMLPSRGQDIVSLYFPVMFSSRATSLPSGDLCNFTKYVHEEAFEWTNLAKLADCFWPVRALNGQSYCFPYFIVMYKLRVISLPSEDLCLVTHRPSPVYCACLQRPAGLRVHCWNKIPMVDVRGLLKRDKEQ